MAVRNAPAHARWSARSRDANETASIGAALGRSAPNGAVILLEGPLGAGKTTFAQGVAAGCGVREPVTSPTYNLVLHYRGDRPFTHVDLFRLSDARELATLSSPTSMAVMKRQVYEHMEQGAAESLDESNRLMAESFGRPDFAEGVASFVESRPPRFEGVGG